MNHHGNGELHHPSASSVGQGPTGANGTGSSRRLNSARLHALGNSPAGGNLFFGMNSLVGAPSPVSLDDPRVLLLSRQEQQQQQQTRISDDPSLRNLHTDRQDRAVAAAMLVWNAPDEQRMGDGGGGAARSSIGMVLPAWPGTHPTDPFRNDSARRRWGANVHVSSAPAGQLSQRELQQALLRGDVPLGFGADETDSEGGRQRRGANVVGYCPPSGRMQMEARNWAAILAEYPAPGELATMTTATSASGE